MTQTWNRIQTQIPVLAGLAFAAIILLAAVTAWDVHSMSRAEDDEVQRQASLLVATFRLRGAIGTELALVGQMPGPPAPEQVAEATVAMEGVNAAARALLAIPGHPVPPEDVAAVETLNRALMAPIFNGGTGRRAYPWEARAALLARTESLVRQAEAALADLHAEVNRRERQVLGRLAAVAILALVTFSALCFLLVTRVIRPLASLQAAAHRIGAGDFGARIGVPATGEFADVARAFNDMVVRIEESISQLREANDALMLSNQAKSQFLNTVSHELRTPLSTIVGYAEFLEDGLAGPLNSEQANYLGEIQAGARRLTLLVDDLLDVARIDAGTFHLELRDVDLREKVDQALRSLVPQARAKRIRVDANLPATCAVVLMDPARIEQVLLILIGNAIKFTPIDGKVLVNVNRTDQAVEVAVQDTGIGIPASQLSRVFDKFYQVDPSTTRDFGGAGLGLYISRAIVEAHGGHISVQSQEGQGSRFAFDLPANPPKVA